MFLAPFVVLAAPGDLDPTYGVSGVTRLLPTPTYFNVATFSSDQSGLSVFAWPCAGVVAEDTCVSRLTPSGELDLSFGIGGVSRISFSSDHLLKSIYVQLDGTVTLLATCASQSNGRDLCLAQLDSSGSLDSAFGTNGKSVIDMSQTSNWAHGKLQRTPAGRWLIATSCPGACVVLLAANGVLDASFGDLGKFVFDEFGFYSDAGAFAGTDAIYAVGDRCLDVAGYARCIKKITWAGQIDATFNTNGAALVLPQLDSATSITQHPDGRILIAGNSGGQVAAVAVDALGVLDPNFGSGGVAKTPSLQGYPTNLHLSVDALDETIVVSYACLLPTSPLQPQQFEFCAARFLSNGIGSMHWSARLPSTFLGRLAYPNGLGVTSDSKVLLGGTCGDAQSLSVCSLRLKGGPYDSSTCTLNADLNNQVAGNDGVLAIRYLLGHTGNALTDGALGANPGRTAQQIESHLAQLKTDGKLDVDGDGVASAMTDGLLILRAMLGLSGDALIAGARNAAHPNVRDARQILTWIETTHGVACLP